MACKQLKNQFLQNKQQGNAQFMYNLENQIDDFKRGYNSSQEELDASDLLRGVLGKVKFNSSSKLGEEVPTAMGSATAGQATAGQATVPAQSQAQSAALATAQQQQQKREMQDQIKDKQAEISQLQKSMVSI